MTKLQVQGVDFSGLDDDEHEGATQLSTPHTTQTGVLHAFLKGIGWLRTSSK